MTGLPPGWALEPLASIAAIQGGIQKQAKRRPDRNPYPFLRVANVTANGLKLDDVHEIELFEGEIDRYRLLPGDLLVVEGNGSAAQIGRASVWNGSIPNTVHQNHLIRVRPGPRVLPEYLGYAWNAPSTREYLSNVASSSSGLHTLSVRKLKMVQVPVPPLDEQRQIVEILEDHLSRIDAADAAIARQIERFGALRLSRLQEDRAGVVAAGAPLRRIDDIATTALGKMLDSKRSGGRPTPYLRNINVRWGRIDTSDTLEVPLTDDERVRFALRAGDLLVCEGGEPGRCAVWEGSDSLMAYQKALHRLRVDMELIEPDFLAAMLEYIIRSGRANRLFTGTTIKHLPQEKLRTIEIPVPDLNTQRTLIAELSSFEDSVRRLRDELETAERRTELLRRSLLASAFKGQLTGSSSTDIERVEEMAGV